MDDKDVLVELVNQLSKVTESHGEHIDRLLTIIEKLTDRVITIEKYLSK